MALRRGKVLAHFPKEPHIPAIPLNKEYLDPTLPPFFAHLYREIIIGNNKSERLIGSRYTLVYWGFNVIFSAQGFE